MGNSSQLLDEILSTVEAIGVSNTIKTLQEAKVKHEVSDVNIEFILNSVSEITNVSVDKILYGYERNDDRKIALSLCVYFIKTEFQYSFRKLSEDIFKKDGSNLYRYYNAIDRCPKKPITSFDKKVDGYIKKMNLLLTEKKLNNAK